MADNEDVSLRGLFGKSKECGDVKIDDIMNHIFINCAGNSSMCETHKLILFITPFVQENAMAVEELKRTLDPNNSNPEINVEQFHRLMKVWVSTFSDEEDPHNITPRDFRRLDEGDLSYVQSTPKSSFGHHLLKEYVESGIMNASNCSKYSLCEFSTAKGPDKTVLEEQIHELEYQKKKMAEELERMKSELVASLEANDYLQKQLDKANKKLNNEQKLVERLQQLANKDDDYEAELEAIKKHKVNLERTVSTLEKKIGDLNEELAEMRVENEKLEKLNDKLSKKNKEAIEEIVELQTEIEAWKQDFTTQKELYAALKEEKNGLEEIIEQNTCDIEKLKFEKNTLESFLKPVAKESSNFSTTFTRSNSFNRSNERDARQNVEEVSKDSDSGDDLPMRLHYMAATSNTNESLQEEISKATSEGCSNSEFGSDKEEKCSENEQKFPSTPSDLLDSQSCVRDDDLKIAQLNNEVSDLKTRLALSEDKETMLLERNRKLEENLEEKKRHLTELTFKLTEYHKLSSKCKELTEEKERLDKENQEQYIKIVDLTLKMSKLMDKSEFSRCKVKQEEEENLNKIIEELKDKVQQIEVEKYRLDDVLHSMEEERVSLKIEIQTLLTKIMNLEEKARDLEHEKTMLRYEKDNLVIKTSSMEIELQEVQRERKTLKDENDELRKDVEKLQQEVLSAKSSSSTLEQEQRDLIELNFKLKIEKLEKDKLTILEERDILLKQIDSINERRNEFVREINNLRKELRSKEKQLEHQSIQFNQSQEDLKESDEERCEMEKEIESLRKDLKEFSCLKHDFKELNHSHEKLSQELKVCNQKLQENKHEISSLKEIEEQYNSLLEEIKKANEDNETLNAEIKKLKNQIEEYETLKENQREKLQQTIIDKDDIQNEVVKLKEDLSGLTEKNKEIALNLQKARSDSTMVKNDKYSLQCEHETLKKKYNDLQEKYQVLNDTMEKNQKEFDVLKVTHDICKEKSKELNIKCSKDMIVYHEEIERTQKDREQVRQENLNLKSQIETMDSEIIQLKEKLVDYHDEKHKLNEMKYKLERENKELMTKLEKNEENLKKRDVEKDQLNAKNFDLQIQLKKIEMTITSYKKINEDLQKLLQKKDELINELKEEIISLKKSNENIKIETNKLQEKTTELEEIKMKLKLKESVISQVEQEVVMLKETKQNINEELFLHREMCESYKHKIQEMETLIESLENRIKENDGQLKDREIKLVTLQKEIDNKFEELKEITKNFEKLKGEKVNAEELQRNIDTLKQEIQRKNSILKCLVNENKNLKSMLENPEHQILLQLKNLSEENQFLREEHKISSEQDKEKMIIELNKSFSNAMEKIYSTEKKMCETEEDFCADCQREIEKYKKEIDTLKRNYEKFLGETGSILNRLKHVEREMETTKDELEEQESWSLPNLRGTRRKTVETRSEGKLNIKRSNYDKLAIKKDKLEQRIMDLEEHLNTEKKKLVEAVSEKKVIEEKLKALNEENNRLQEKLKGIEDLKDLMGEIKLTKEELKKLLLKTQEDKQLGKKVNTFVLKPATFIPKQKDPLEDFKFASSGDAGRSRDLGVLFPRQQENPDINLSIENDSLEENVLSTINEEILQSMEYKNADLSFQNIPDNELEEKFEKISSACNLDLDLMTSRLIKQEQKVAVRKQRILKKLNTCESFLNEYRGIVGLRPVLAHLDSVGKCYEDLCDSAELLGCLKREKTLMGCLKILITYSKRSRRALRDAEDRFLCTECHRIKNVKSHLEVITYNPSIPQVNLNPTNTQIMRLEKSTIMETHISPRPLVRTKKLVTYCLSAWFTILTIFCLLMAYILRQEYTLSIGDYSVDDSWIPFVKKQYVRGPPPT